MTINDKIFDTFPILKSSRLTLCEIQISDAAKIYEMRASGRVNQFIARDNMKDLHDAVQLVERTPE